MKTALILSSAYVLVAAGLFVSSIAGGHGPGAEALYYLGWPATIAYDAVYFEQRGSFARLVILGAVQWLVNGFLIEVLVKAFLEKWSARKDRSLEKRANS